MAILDAMFDLTATEGGQDMFSDTTDVISTNVIDFGEGMTGLEMGAGTPMYLNIKVGDTDWSAVSTVVFKLMGHSSATITSGSVIVQTGSITASTLDAGDWILRVALPVNVDAARYVGLVATCAGTETQGDIHAWIDNGPQSSYDTQVAVSNI